MIRNNIIHIFPVDTDQAENLKRQRLKVWHIKSGFSTDLEAWQYSVGTFYYVHSCLTPPIYNVYILYITYIPGFVFMKVQCFDPLSATAMGVSLQKTGVASFI